MNKYRIVETIDKNFETRFYIMERFLFVFWRYKMKYTLGGRRRCCYSSLDRAKESLAWFGNLDRSRKTKRVRVVQ